MKPAHRDGARRTIAPAKINWTLEVLGRRPDGFHEIRSVMQTLSLTDELEAAPAEGASLHVEGLGAESLGSADNLVARVMSEVPKPAGGCPVAFRLHKRIPAAAGLGGGSSDAAAALRLLQRLWGLGGDNVFRSAAALGSDVPFFLRGGAQIASGRGEILMPLPDGDPVDVLIATPPIALPSKTARLYAALTAEHYTDGGATERLAERIREGRGPRPDDYINVFDRMADAVFPDLREYRDQLTKVTGRRPLLAGAGPSLFVILDGGVDTEQGDHWCQALEWAGFFVAAVSTLPAGDAIAVA